MQPVVQITNLTKEFKGKRAVDDVSFSVQRGEIVAILGPNGAGKSTTMLMMLGLLKPTSGEAKLFQAVPDSRAVHERIGVMLQQVSLMDALKVKELLALFQSYYPDPLSMEKLVELTGMTPGELDKRTEKLSGGQKRRVGFALALAGNPDLLFFDEPTVGMDSTARKQFWQTVKELAEQGKTILFSTHYLQEADDIATRIILFNQGKVIADGSPMEIKRSLLRQSISFKMNETIRKENLTNMQEVLAVIEDKGRLTIMTENPDFVLRSLFELKIRLEDIAIEKGRLEDAFEQLTVEQEVS
ncbi:ABC transporter ATP-binding protein [Sporosarcina sp. Te-1]|uniref:ABC transporter ATP-binding protein n=1 Tax=Sporosarcina sp. Te-1 TaxID=2818390 RepID=UPI001A9DE37B|nr:ABC transporter ATP-binding protein [Sporosarcina sp. Te-1]QTD42937.1 ABC transporter ATP-binding protein [Sporosarcina sp. Te-1]